MSEKDKLNEKQTFFHQKPLQLPQNLPLPQCIQRSCEVAAAATESTAVTVCRSSTGIDKPSAPHACCIT